MGRTLHTIIKGGCLAAAAFVSSPAFADDGDLTLQPNEDWVLRQQSDRCRVSRTFGSDENTVTVYLDQATAGPFYNLTLIGRPFRNPYGRAINVQFGPDEPPSLRSYIQATSSKGRPSLTMFGVTLTPPQIVDGASFPVEDLSRERLDAITHVRLWMSIVEPVRLNIGPLGDILMKQRECASILAGQLQFAERIHPPKLVNPGELGRQIRYPAYLLRNEMDGLVKFRLTVDENGKPTFCSILDSTRPQLFDDEVCLSLLRHAKFTGATDAVGKPIASQFTSAVRFAVSR